MEAVMTGWTAAAEQLADAIREPGFRAAEVTASAWRAGVHAEATHGLVGAALALTRGDAQGSLWAQAEPCPKDSVLLGQATELEGAVAELLAWCRRLIRDCREAWGAASLRAAAAQAAITAAQARLASARSQGEAAAAEAAIASAQAQLSAAQAEIADCEAAMEIIGNTGTALDYALKCLRHVPDDFAQHYEVPYQHKREAGPLPHKGSFMTGAAA
jgi:hypothetical protein